MSEYGNKRVLTDDIANTKYGNWKKNTLIDTLSLALYKASGRQF